MISKLEGGKFEEEYMKSLIKRGHGGGDDFVVEVFGLDREKKKIKILQDFEKG